jgi:hypothetical protein
LATRGPTFWEDFAHGARHSPLGGMGLANFMFRLKGYSQDQINRASAAADQEYGQQQAYAKAHDTGGIGHYAHAAGSLLSEMLGHTDPTFALGAGRTIAAKAAAQAGIQFPASLVRQSLDVSTGRRKSISPREAVTDAAEAAGGAVVLHGAGKAIGKGYRVLRDMVAPPEATIPTAEVAPAGQRQTLVSPTSEVAPPAKDGLPGNGSVRPMDPAMITSIMKNDEPLPVRQRDVPEEAAGPRTHKGFTELKTTDDGTKFLNYQAQNGQTIPIKMGIEPDGTAEIAVDQFGDGKNKLGPREIRSAMYDLMDMYPDIKSFGGYRRSGAGAGRVQEITPPARADAEAPTEAPVEAPQEATPPATMPHDDLVSTLPPANQEFLRSQPSNVVDFPQNDTATPHYDAMAEQYKNGELADVLTPAELQDMDASAPKPVVDNTGYEAHTPNIDTPPAAANDVSRADALRGLVPSILADESGALGYRDGKPGKVKLEDIPDEDLTPEQRVTLGIKKALPVLTEQDQLRTAEKAKRFEAARNTKRVADGEEGFHQELSQLSGELPQLPNPYTIRPKITPDDVRDLFNKVRDHPALDYTDSIHAREGLDTLLNSNGHSLPTRSQLEALQKVFPLDGKQRSKSISSWIADVINAPRSIMASTDLSAPLRQGLPLIHTKEYWSSFASMFKQIGEQGFNDVRNEIRSRPSYWAMKNSGLALADVDDKDLSHHEERFMSQIVKRIPVAGKVVMGSERAYVGFLNKLRADTFDRMLTQAKAAGSHLDEKDLKDFSDFINTATGRGDLNHLVPKFLRGEEFDANKASPLLSGTLFAPRLMASRIRMMTQVFDPRFYTKVSPIARKEAIKSMLAYTGFVMTTLGLAKASGLSVEMDPRSTDFARIKIGNTRYDPTAGFQPYVRLAAQVITGQKKGADGSIQSLSDPKYGQPNKVDALGSFLKNKESPALAEVHDLLAGEDRDFNKVDIHHLDNVRDDLAKDFVPLLLQDMHDVYNDQGAKGVAIGILPDTFGVGVQTYTPRAKKDKGSVSTKDFKSDFGNDFKSDFKKDF